MALKIGDNFSYLGKKFLDDRESFDTLSKMNSCLDVPEGFITFCKEDRKRYEFIEGAWSEYVVVGSGGGIDLEDVFHVGLDTPNSEEVLWLCDTEGLQEEITFDNPVIVELISVIDSLKSKINILEQDIEYLKLHGGGSGGSDTPETPDTDGKFLLLEDGSELLFEDGSNILLEIQ